MIYRSFYGHFFPASLTMPISLFLLSLNNKQTKRKQTKTEYIYNFNMYIFILYGYFVGKAVPVCGARDSFTFDSRSHNIAHIAHCELYFVFSFFRYHSFIHVWRVGFFFLLQRCLLSFEFKAFGSDLVFFFSIFHSSRIAWRKPFVCKVE